MNGQDLTWQEATSEFHGSLVVIDCGEEGCYVGEVEEVDPKDKTITLKSPERNGIKLKVDRIKLSSDMICDVEVLQLRFSPDEIIDGALLDLSQHIGYLLTIDCYPTAIYQGVLLSVSSDDATITLEQPFLNGKPIGDQKLAVTREMMVDLHTDGIRVFERFKDSVLTSSQKQHPLPPPTENTSSAKISKNPAKKKFSSSEPNKKGKRSSFAPTKKSNTNSTTTVMVPSNPRIFVKSGIKKSLNKANNPPPSNSAGKSHHLDSSLKFVDLTSKFPSPDHPANKSSILDDQKRINKFARPSISTKIMGEMSKFINKAQSSINQKYRRTSTSTGGFAGPSEKPVLPGKDKPRFVSGHGVRINVNDLLDAKSEGQGKVLSLISDLTSTPKTNGRRPHASSRNRTNNKSLKSSTNDEVSSDNLSTKDLSKPLEINDDLQCLNNLVENLDIENASEELLNN